MASEESIDTVCGELHLNKHLCIYHIYIYDVLLCIYHIYMMLLPSQTSLVICLSSFLPQEIGLSHFSSLLNLNPMSLLSGAPTLPVSKWVPLHLRLLCSTYLLTAFIFLGLDMRKYNIFQLHPFTCNFHVFIFISN